MELELDAACVRRPGPRWRYPQWAAGMARGCTSAALLETYRQRRELHDAETAGSNGAVDVQKIAGRLLSVLELAGSTDRCVVQAPEVFIAV